MRRAGRWFLAAAVLLALAAFFAFVPAGYIASAMCFLFFSAVCALFGLMRLWDTKAAKTLSRLAAGCLAVLLALFWAAEIPVIADMRSDKDTSADYAIVFGAGVNGTTPSLSLLDRLEAALRWLEEHPDGIAVVSGCQGPNEQVSEARVMFDWLTARGIEPERVVMEEQAGSSYENVLYSLALIEKLGGDPTGRVALISSEYHLHRLCMIAGTFGCEYVRVAGETSIFPLKINYAVREAFGVWRIWVLGPG